MSQYIHPLSTGELTDYWLGECSPEIESSIDEHLLACDLCSRRMGELANLAQGVGMLARTCAGGAVVTASFVSRLKAQGVRVREYRLAPSGSVFCTITPEEDLAVAYLSAQLEGVNRLDLALYGPVENAVHRLTDIPFNAAAGEVVIAPDAAYLRTLDIVTQTMELIAVESSGSERSIGHYTFNHSPHWRR